MFRWMLMVKKLFTPPHHVQEPSKQRKTRRLKATVKPGLEALEDRTLLSVSSLPIVFTASPPAVPSLAAVTAYVSSMMDQWNQTLAILQQDFSMALNAVGQQIAQEASFVQQQVDNLLGINPNSLNPAPNPAVTQADSGTGRGNGSGSGRGSGASTTHNNQNPGSNPGTTQTGSGSGSGTSATSANDNVRQHGITNGEPMSSGSSVCGSLDGTTVGFGASGAGSGVPEEVNCNPTSITIPVYVFQADPDCAVSVDYATSDGTALAGTDYEAESGTLSFAAGTTGPDYITIPIKDDGTDETVGSQYFYVTLSNPVNAMIVQPAQIQVKILEQQQAATDTLRWNPCPGDGFNASTVTNWYDVTQGFQLEEGDLGPNPSSPIQFDASTSDSPNSDAPITWNQSYTVASISVQGGYNAAQTVNYGVGLEMDGANGVTLTVDSSSTADFELAGNNNLQTDTGTAEIDGDMFVNFLAAGSVRTINGTKETVNDDIDYGTGGKVNIINNGTLNLGNGFLATQSSGSPINVTNGQLTFGADPDTKGLNTFQLSNASADINIGPNGNMTLYDKRTDLINTANGGAVITNNGTATLKGDPTLGNDTTTGVYVPLQNHGTVNINGGRWWFGTTDASGNAMSMDAGVIKLNNNATIKVKQYTQTGGAFQIVDANETFIALPGTALNFNGGAVQFSTVPSVLNTQSIVFNGTTLNMMVLYNSTTSDLINCTNCTIQGKSTINVQSFWLQSEYGGWTLIQSAAAITGDFQIVNLPDGVHEEPVSNVVLRAFEWAISELR